MKISLQIQLPATVRETVEIAAAAEEAGFDAAWFASPGRSTDVFMALGAVARATSRIELGTAIATIWVRHPYITYQQAIALQEVADGRFTLGLGVSHHSFVEALGLRYERPVQAITEYTSIVRALVDHGKVDYRGECFSATIESGQPELPLPIYMAVVGGRMSAVAGGLADGVVPVATPPSYVADVIRPELVRASAAAGRTTPKIGVLVPTSLSNSPDEALAGVRRHIGSFPTVPAYEKIFKALDPGEGAAEWNQRTLDAIAIYGGSERALVRADEYAEVGVEELLVMPMDPDGFTAPGMLKGYRALFE